MKLNILLQTLIYDLPKESLHELEKIEIVGLASNSSDVCNGFAFFAINGIKNDGARYVSEALRKGAKLVVHSDKTIAASFSHYCDFNFRDNCWFLYVTDVRKALSAAANLFWPLQPKHVAAVTGTSGKTSVASFTNQLWQAMHYNSASIGTLGVSVPNVANSSYLTTPDTINMHKILDNLAQLKISHVILEASSHGILQCRLDNVRLSSAAFTNLGRDHLDYHLDIESYFAAKMRLFKELLADGCPVILFADDEYSDRVLQHLQPYHDNILKIGQRGDFIKLKAVHKLKEGQILALRIDGKDYDNIFFPLHGDFQLYNALVAMGLVIAEGAAIEPCLEMLSKLHSVSGRMQLIGNKQNGALVYVDYAHKPEALMQVLREVKTMVQGKIILVFGCGGDRDKGKRPIMGQIAGEYSDIVIITDDNPRGEPAESIRKEIIQAVPSAIEIANRSEAIAYAINIAKANDIVLVAGKGHEVGQIIGDKSLPFSDKDEILRWLNY
ncbi:UDP-N-acetylmuramoyl-L-alanyl-D-glutamate--2,6-diaminopimelate ligase [Bartonella sp. TP]|uniref:UDP-N-acetylmuramoyl-L-alanyl-D-glutamate--2, 6-diaminopimelate ligase n=1 Tax=Bartonella sp. TP TaxID=3057550 RepID=UPI0025AF2CD0|nr:UDP-N-acetylmuramoyl-L-alanyl-D-glutamate--2,6-diaminopimelate ligase [Bartonella sp. TP]WJW79758.1 UDP-N-acetylmuramoyl-L-alanyl-D-glutamate--2,6-diaminopimelate ligase [Bartonella sp. TP]